MGLTSESDIVEVGRGLDGLDLATNVEFLYTFVEVSNGWVSGVVGSENFSSFLNEIGLVNIVNCDDRKWFIITRITENNSRSRFDRELVNIFLRDIQCNGHGEESAVGES